jgi:hypothetical protein
VTPSNSKRETFLLAKKHPITKVYQAFLTQPSNHETVCYAERLDQGCVTAARASGPIRRRA